MNYFNLHIIYFKLLFKIFSKPSLKFIKKNLSFNSILGKSKHNEPEKIYMQAPSHHDFHHEEINHPPPTGYHGGQEFDNPAFIDQPPSSYHSKRSPVNSAYLEHPPQSYNNANLGYQMQNANQQYGNFNKEQNYPSIAPQSYQRSFKDSVFNDLNRIAKIMEKYVRVFPLFYNFLIVYIHTGCFDQCKVLYIMLLLNFFKYKKNL